jgi:hypothetical protein
VGGFLAPCDRDRCSCSRTSCRIFRSDEYTALEPHIGKRTLEIHHDKHHAKYVSVTNEMIKGTDLENASLEEIVLKAKGTTTTTIPSPP